MPAQYGRTTVLRSLRRMKRTGKVLAATLQRRVPGSDDFTDTQVYANTYLYPNNTISGLGTDGYPSGTANMVLWQAAGETKVPEVDNRIVRAGTTYLIVVTSTRQNADAGFAIHDLTVTEVV